jgi:hypothetical protein
VRWQHPYELRPECVDALLEDCRLHVRSAEKFLVQPLRAKAAYTQAQQCIRYQTAFGKPK